MLSLEPAGGLLQRCLRAQQLPALPTQGRGQLSFPRGPALHRLCAQTPGSHREREHGRCLGPSPSPSPGKTRGRTCEREGRGLSCGPSPGDPATSSRLPQKPTPSSIFTLQTDRETKAWRGGHQPKSRNQESRSAKRIQAPVLAWITSPQAGAQLVEDMVLGLGTLKPPTGGPAGPTKPSASIISHSPCSLFEMDPYTFSTVCQPTDPSIHPSFHPSIHPSVHMGIHPSVHPGIHHPSNVSPSLKPGLILSIPSKHTHTHTHTYTHIYPVFFHAPFSTSVHPSTIHAFALLCPHTFIHHLSIYPSTPLSAHLVTHPSIHVPTHQPSLR